MDPAIKTKLVVMGVVTALVIFGVGVAAGAMLRPLLIIPLLGVVLLVLHMLGKFGDWKKRFRNAPGAALLRLVGTYIAQCAFAAVTYLVGFGGARLFGRDGDLHTFGAIDLYLAAGLLIVGGAISVLVVRTSRQITGDLQDMMADLQSDLDGLQADLGGMTDDNE